MRSRLAAALQQLPVLARPRRRRVRAPRHAASPPPRGLRAAPPARTPSVLTMSMRLVSRCTMGEARVPYLRMSGRWLAEHGFVIGAPVYVHVEPGRVVLTNAAPQGGASGAELVLPAGA